jgi:hypothetical protein
MKTILCLIDETGPPIMMLQDAPPERVLMHEFEAKPGCNCDRWGHPCPSWVERNPQAKAELSISSCAKPTR